MSNRIRVAYVLHAMQVAGAEVLVCELVRRLRDRIDPTIFCLDAVGPLGEQLRAEGIPVIALDRRPGRDWSVAWRLAREIRSREMSVVHAHQYSPFFYAALAKLANGGNFRLILTEHGRHFPDEVSSLRRGINRLFFDRLADAVNAVCAFSAKALCRNDGFAGRRIEVIENGIEADRYLPATERDALRERLGLPAQRRCVTMVARLHPVKDHAMLLRAFARLRDRVPDVDLLLAGDGPLRQDLEKQAQMAGMADRVRFLGIRRDVPDLLRASDAFALTSVSEAASLTLLEAMAAALPVVVTRVGGNPEMVREGIDGLLVPTGDDAACADALWRVLTDRTAATNLGVNGRQRVREWYQLGRTVERYFRLYSRLAGH